MSKTIEFTFSRKSIRSAITEIKKFQKDFEKKCDQFARKLARRGVDIAKVNSGHNKKYIHYKVEKGDEKGVYLLIGESPRITKEWYTVVGNKHIVDENYSPILMAEFGSGIYALAYQDIGYGRGSYPSVNPPNKARFSDEWSWRKSPNGAIKTSSGEQATRPLYSASRGMVYDIMTVAQEVWGV